MARRAPAPPRRRRRLAPTLAAVGLSAIATRASASGMDTPPLVRIPLENYDQMQFFATIRVGEQPFRVIFDTGSSDVWVPSDECRACAGVHRYRSNATRPKPVDDDGREVVTVGEEDAHDEAFTLQYGSGTVKGTAVRDTLRLDDSLVLPNALIGSVHEQGREIQRFQTEGIVGLAMEPLARVSSPNVLQLLRDSSDYALPTVFSLYLSPFPTASPPSQLIFGGIDEALAGEDAVWHRYPVVDDPYSAAFGFWSLALDEMAVQTVGDVDAPYEAIGQSLSADTSPSVAIVDSGTSLVLLPATAYSAVISAMQQRLGSRLRSHSHRGGEYMCRNCDHSEFPAIAFSFRSNALHPTSAGDPLSTRAQRFVLQGSDYVRCENRVCSPQLDVSSSDMVILGDIFLRAYYTVFDFETKQVGFACPRGVCDGGVKPPLDVNTGLAQLADLGVVYLRSSVFVAAAMASLWFIAQLHAWLTMTLTARMTARRSILRSRLHKRDERGVKLKTHHDAVAEVTIAPLAEPNTQDHVGLQAIAY